MTLTITDFIEQEDSLTVDDVPPDVRERVNDALADLTGVEGSPGGGNPPQNEDAILVSKNLDGRAGFTSIQGAIDGTNPQNGATDTGASDGDTIFVEPGTYNKSITVTSISGLTITSTQGPNQTTIDAMIDITGVEDTTINGFEIPDAFTGDPDVLSPESEVSPRFTEPAGSPQINVSGEVSNVRLSNIIQRIGSLPQIATYPDYPMGTIISDVYYYVDVSDINTISTEMSGAGGQNGGEWDGGAGGSLAATIDVADTKELELQVGESPRGKNGNLYGGWGWKNGGAPYGSFAAGIGGGGGGATAVIIDGEPVAIAHGGGGGAAWDTYTFYAGGGGGAGGKGGPTNWGDTGEDGEAPTDGSNLGGNGAGGTEAENKDTFEPATDGGAEVVDEEFVGESEPGVPGVPAGTHGFVVLLPAEGEQVSQ